MVEDPDLGFHHAPVTTGRLVAREGHARVREQTRLAHHRPITLLGTGFESGGGHLVAVTGRPLANTAFTDGDHLERILRPGLRHIQLRPDLIDGCLAGTGLTLTHQPTTVRRAQ